MGLSLGIDIGTSKVACVLLDNQSKELVDVATEATQANCSTKPNFGEQDGSCILTAIDKAIAALKPELKHRVTSIGITGQMHGVIFWRDGFSETSQLITWQDGRCNEGTFLQSLYQKCGDTTLRSGYGCATLAWLAEYEPKFLASFSHAATIHDFFAAKICNLSKATTDPSDAASWGLFDIAKSCWKIEKVKAVSIPEQLLPEISATGSVIGKLTATQASQWGISSEIPVVCAIGDNQASIYSTLDNPGEELALTLGTGGQLSAVVSDLSEALTYARETVDIRPYVGGTWLIVAASLSGGSVFSWLVKVLQDWFAELGIQGRSKEELFAKLDSLALTCPGTSLIASSSFLGERHDPSLRGSIEQIDLDNFKLSNFTLALLEGAVSNLKSMLPQELISSRKRIIGSGNGLRRVRTMTKVVENLFGLPLVLVDEKEEAACGAALLAIDSCHNI